MSEHNPLLLAIDDEPNTLELLAIGLEEYGFNIVKATSGEAGLEQARLLHPDLILLDIQMPGTNGYQVCAQLKAQQATSEIPVIFLTALATPEYLARGFAAGAADFITKPVKPLELYARVTARLQDKRFNKNLLERLDRYQQTQGKLEASPDEHSKISRRHLDQVNKARDLLVNDIKAPPSLVELAHAVGSNTHKLSRDFKILYAMTVFEWLREHRLQTAGRLLRESDLGVEAIADLVGYSSGPNLSTAFKKRFGVSPKYYRCRPRP